MLAGLRNQIAQLCQSPRSILRTILALDDTHHAVALGTAVGMFFGLLPVTGLQIALVIFASLFVRFNRPAGVLATYVTNP